MELDVVRIEGLNVDCVVGVYPDERNASQPLLVDVSMFFDTEPAGVRESFHRTVDYAACAAQLVFLLRTCRFRMLETAGHVLAKYLLAPPAPGERRAQVERLDLKLTKPGAIRGFAVPSLTISRNADWCSLARETKEWGAVDVIHETQACGIYRLNIRPGGGIPLHIHRRMRESEMVLTKGLTCQRRPVQPGTVHRWPRGAAHCYQNESARWQSILCVDTPRFMPEDEIVVEGEPADVAPEPPWGPIAWSTP